MTKHPWQIWSIFLLCLATALPAMGWLTHKALELDRAEALAQRQADLEATVGSVLWQMDAELTRLLAPEIARPAHFYRPFLTEQNGTKTAGKLPSPLLMQPSDVVLLHFEILPDGTWLSPQCPPDEFHDLAIANSISASNIELSHDRLASLSREVSFTQLLDKLPEETLANERLLLSQWAANTGLNEVFRQSRVVNTLDYAPMQPQAEVPPNAAYQQAFEQDAPQQLAANGYGEIRNQRAQSRQSADLLKREEAFQAAAQQAMADQRQNFNYPVPPVLSAEGISQPLWVDSHLLLARRVQVQGETRIQGCWLDWPQIKQKLLAGASNLLPNADLERVVDVDQVQLNRVLATLPAHLVVSEPVAVTMPLSPIRVSLIVAWSFLLFAAGAVAIVLQSVVKLSERRAAFVSAVTHELRTPLTTFRMYAEMLAAGMVTEADQRQSYLETLQVEADRLSHLVENVLQYARLERGSPARQRQRVGVAELLERIAPRLDGRAGQAGMKLVVDIDPTAEAKLVLTDPTAVEQILFNLVDNACKYANGSTDRRIHLQIGAEEAAVTFAVIDHGPGIAAREAERLFRPFAKSAQEAAHSAPGVGLGLALSRRLAIDLGGRLVAVCPDGRGQEAGGKFILHLPVAN